MQNPNFIFSKGLGFLAWFLYFFILLLIDITNKKFVFLVGLTYGVLSYGLFTNWLINYDFLVWVVVFVVYGLFFGILFVLLKFIRSHFRKFGFFIQWATICGFEYIKTKGFFGFSYGVSGYTQWNYSVLIQCVEFIGVFGLSALIIFPSVVLENLFYEYKICKNVSKKFYYSLLTWFIIFVSFLIFGFVKLNKIQTKQINQTVKVAAIQNNENPFLNGIDIYTENVNELIRLTEKAFEENPDINFVIWPETSVVPSIMLQYYNPTDKKREKLIQNLLNYIESKNATFVIGNAHVDIDKSNKIFLILGVVFIFLLWELLSLISQNDFIVPSISNTMKALGEMLTKSDTYNILFSTILRLLSSITICFILALTLAVFSNINERVKYFLKPLISLLKTLPVATIIIMLLVMIGRSIAPYFIVGLVVLPLIYEIVLNALEAIDKDIIDEVKMVSSGKDFTVLKRIYLPLITPYLLTSLIQAFGLGLKVLVMAEFIAETKNSIGEVIRFYKNEALTEYVFAWTIILVLFILLIDLLLHYIKKKIL